MFKADIWLIANDPNIKREEKRRFWEKFLYADESLLSQDDWDRAWDLANTWDTCACGSLDDGLPRKAVNGVVNIPVDQCLIDLGSEFPDYIHDGDLEGARKCFLDIQERGAKLLEPTLFGDTNV